MAYGQNAPSCDPFSSWNKNYGQGDKQEKVKYYFLVNLTTSALFQKNKNKNKNKTNKQTKTKTHNLTNGRVFVTLKCHFVRKDASKRSLRWRPLLTLNTARILIRLYVIAKERLWRNYITTRPLKNCKVKRTSSYHVSLPMYQNNIIAIPPYTITTIPSKTAVSVLLKLPAYFVLSLDVFTEACTICGFPCKNAASALLNLCRYGFLTIGDRIDL